MATVVLLGTMDTKGREYAWLAERIRTLGCDVVVVDAGVHDPVGITPDVGREETAAAAGADVARLAEDGDRGAAVTALGRGAAEILTGLHDEGRLDAVLAVGGSGGSSIAATAMAALPIGVGKFLVSTMASGDVSPYVGAKDVAISYSVVDIAGINRLSRVVLGNAAAAAAGMARAGADDLAEEEAADDRPLVAASMFGVTTPAVEKARERLEELGYEVLVFHATGAGGRALETLAADGLLAGVLDLTTTELADDLVGGVLSAGPDRLTAATEAGLPQVVAPGALDMVNFGPRETVPERFEDRNLYVHNPTVTLMRTTPDEMDELGRRIAEKLRGASAATVFIPRRGVSMLDAEGEPFHDPDADAGCFAAIISGLEGSGVEIEDLDAHVNDSEFAVAMADRLHTLIESAGTPAGGASA